MERTIVTQSGEETQQLGFDLAKKLSGGEVFALYGELGSGKTTFTQGLAKGLGITGRIISPTYIIMRTYHGSLPVNVSSEAPARLRSLQNDSSRQARIITFYHVDLYRVESEHDIEGLGLLELLGKEENVIVIEWPEKLGALLPKNVKKIHFTYEDDEHRKITYE
jgi:tRNA threonylcarbamoyladenosine biosynthesis protein TsaE